MLMANSMQYDAVNVVADVPDRLPTNVTFEDSEAGIPEEVDRSRFKKSASSVRAAKRLGEDPAQIAQSRESKLDNTINALGSRSKLEKMGLGVLRGVNALLWVTSFIALALTIVFVASSASFIDITFEEYEPVIHVDQVISTTFWTYILDGLARMLAMITIFFVFFTFPQRVILYARRIKAPVSFEQIATIALVTAFVIAPAFSIYGVVYYWIQFARFAQARHEPDRVLDFVFNSFEEISKTGFVINVVLTCILVTMVLFFWFIMTWSLGHIFRDESITEKLREEAAATAKSSRSFRYARSLRKRSTNQESAPPSSGTPRPSTKSKSTAANDTAITGVFDDLFPEDRAKTDVDEDFDEDAERFNNEEGAQRAKILNEPGLMQLDGPMSRSVFCLRSCCSRLRHWCRRGDCSRESFFGGVPLTVPILLICYCAISMGMSLAFEYHPSTIPFVSIITLFRVCFANSTLYQDFNSTFTIIGLNGTDMHAMIMVSSTTKQHDEYRFSTCSPENVKQFARAMAIFVTFVLECLVVAQTWSWSAASKQNLRSVPYAKTRPNQIGFNFFRTVTWVAWCFIVIIGAISTAFAPLSYWTTESVVLFTPEEFGLTPADTMAAYNIDGLIRIELDPLFSIGVTPGTPGFGEAYLLMGVWVFLLAFAYLPPNAYGCQGWCCHREHSVTKLHHGEYLLYIATEAEASQLLGLQREMEAQQKAVQARIAAERLNRRRRHAKASTPRSYAPPSQSVGGGQESTREFLSLPPETQIPMDIGGAGGSVDDSETARNKSQMAWLRSSAVGAYSYAKQQARGAMGFLSRAPAAAQGLATSHADPPSVAAEEVFKKSDAKVRLQHQASNAGLVPDPLTVPTLEEVVRPTAAAAAPARAPGMDLASQIQANIFCLETEILLFQHMYITYPMSATRASDEVQFLNRPPKNPGPESSSNLLNGEDPAAAEPKEEAPANSRVGLTFEEKQALIEDKRFRLVEHMAEPKTDTHFFVSVSDDRIIIGFRGTVSITNMRTDADSSEVEHPFSKTVKPLLEPGSSIHARAVAARPAMVHNGFMVAYESVKADITRIVESLWEENPYRVVFVTGHSLGAGLAVMCAFDLAVRYNLPNRQRVAVTTWGSPRIGTYGFAARVNRVISCAKRFVVTGDIITKLPVDPRPFRELTLRGWFHVGVEVLLDMTGNMLLRPSPVEKFIMQKSVSSIARHLRVSYASSMMVWAQRSHGDGSYTPDWWSFIITQTLIGLPQRIRYVPPGIKDKLFEALARPGVAYVVGSRTLRDMAADTTERLEDTATRGLTPPPSRHNLILEEGVRILHALEHALRTGQVAEFGHGVQQILQVHNELAAVCEEEAETEDEEGEEEAVDETGFTTPPESEEDEEANM